VCNVLPIREQHHSIFAGFLHDDIEIEKSHLMSYERIALRQLLVRLAIPD
jgi:hypothetical protein